jgi:hypothetical protein
VAGVTPESAMPFAVGGRLAVPSMCIAAEARSVGAPLVGALAEGRHEPCPCFADGLVTRHLSLVTALLNSSLELTVGSSSKEKPTVARPLSVARFARPRFRRSPRRPP